MTSPIDPRLRLFCIFPFVFAVSLALPLTARQVPTSPAPGTDRPVRLRPAEAARLAKEARQSVSVEMPVGLELTLWAPGRMIVDPVAIDLDERGTVYVTSTSRASMPLDIRGHPTWVPQVRTLKSVEDLLNFYRRELAPVRSAQNTWLQDLNKDGTRDWRDLSEYKERLYRLQDTDGDGLADVSQVMIQGFNEDPTYDVAGGLLYYDGDLFFGSAPGVWRLRDENGDGTIDRQIPISMGYSVHPAFMGHGISGITLGPDGRIYWEVGDIGLNVADKEGHRWSYPNQGAVLRAEPDGSKFEVFATGIRNLQEFAFDEYGNLISVDNDGDHQGETERLVYLTDGSDSGWRSNWQYGKYTDPENNGYNVWMDEGMFKPRFEGQAAYIVPPIAPHHAGPSGMVYNPGTALSDEWRKHFFIVSFPGSASDARIYAFRLKEQGAGFALESEKVLLRGILAVGIKFGPDGALYLTDWITGWESKNDGRIWKLDAPRAASNPVRAEVRRLLQENFAARSAADVASLLRHADMRIRMKAQFDLVRRGDVTTLLAAASDRADQLGRIHALWGIGQLARKDKQQATVLTSFLADADPEICAQAARMIGDARYGDAADKMVPLLRHQSARTRFFAAEALGRLAYKPAVAPLVEMLADNNDRDVYLRHAGSLALARIGDGSAVAALSKHPSPGVRIAAVVALRRLRNPEVGRFLADADEKIVTEAARAINDDGAIGAAVPRLAAVLAEKRLTNEPLLRRAISANLRVGTPDALARLAAFAGDTSRPQTMRAEAIRALGVWPAPSPLDPVDGMYVEQPAAPVARDRTAAGAAVLRLVLTSSKSESNPAVKVALAEAAGRLGIVAAVPMLLDQLRADPSAEVRLAALRGLQAMKAPRMDEVMRIALADRDATVRRAALGIMSALPLSDDAKVQHLATIAEKGAVEDQQAAFDVLAGLKSAGAERLLASSLDALTAGKLAPEIQLDVLEAIRSSSFAALQARLETYQKSRAADNFVTAFRDALLRGGNAARGRQVFTDNATAGCPRCHSVGAPGTNVGPNLTKIAATLSRDQLLQALIEPNARIAPGFATLGITLRNGQRIDGTLREETDAEVVVVTGTPAEERRIPKADIAQRTTPVSAMPPFGVILKPREIRDLVEFLSTLK